MSEETTVQDAPEVEQSSMLSGWMEGAVVVDGETGEPLPAEETQESENEEEPAAEAPKAPAEPAKPEGEQPEAKKEPLKGFGSRFYVSDDATGESRFDTGAAVKFFLPGEGKKVFEHPGRQFAESKTPAEPQKAPWEAEFEEHQKQINEVRERKLSWRKELQEGLRQYGNDWVKAAAYADQKVSEEIENDIRKLEWEMKKKEYGGFQTQKEKDALQAKAAANESAIMSKFKDHNEYAELVYNYGAPIINRLYDLMHPDASTQTRTREEMTEAMNTFWRGIMADKDQGQFVVSLIQSAWVMENLPSMLGTMAERAESQARQNIRGAVRKPTGLKPDPKRTDTTPGKGDPAAEAWNNWLGGDRFSGGGIPEV